MKYTVIHLHNNIFRWEKAWFIDQEYVTIITGFLKTTADCSICKLENECI